MTQWEYLWYRAESAQDFDKMQRFGKEGWELVAVWDGNAYFKRPLLPYSSRMQTEEGRIGENGGIEMCLLS